jgi:hypothetical protein
MADNSAEIALLRTAMCSAGMKAEALGLSVPHWKLMRYK